MEVNYKFNTVVPGDLALLAVVQNAIKIVKTDDGTPEPPAAEAKKPATKKQTPKKSTSKDPDLTGLSFDEIVAALKSVKSPAVRHCRFLAKAFCKRAGDIAEGKKTVRSVLKAVGASNFDDLKDFNGFVDQLIVASDSGNGEDDDLDI